MECHCNSHLFWGPGLGGTPPKKKQMRGKGEHWEGVGEVADSQGLGRPQHGQHLIQAVSVQGCPLLSIAACVCLTYFPSHPVLLQILSGVPVITTFTIMSIGRFQTAPGSQDNQGDKKTSSGIAVLVFLFLPFCWLNSASWPLQEIRPNLTLPASRAAGWKSARSDLAWANAEGQQSFDRTGQEMLQVCIWELSRSLWSPLLLAYQTGEQVWGELRPWGSDNSGSIPFHLSLATNGNWWVTTLSAHLEGEKTLQQVLNNCRHLIN